MSLQLYIVIGLALIFDFLNGVHDSSNIVATMIASRAFRPGTALGLTAVANFFGPFLFGVAVAVTIGEEVAQSTALNLDVLIAVRHMPSSVGWSVPCWQVRGLMHSNCTALRR